ncbi:MAG: hypothetical protein U9O82_06600 [Thermodesulfobacteriota bacterium]|nr:hypothetical protein [Thermodesulfobacteriota bacterium]
MYKILFLQLLILFLVFPGIASALAPPEVIEERNLEADFILIGQVKSMFPDAQPRHFVLAVEHVIKGFGVINKDDQLSILLGPGRQSLKTDKLVNHVQGDLPVKVIEGDPVVVFIKRSDTFPGYFAPMLQGLSVVVIKVK